MEDSQTTKKKMLVTGANGYVGKAIVQLLLSQSVPTRALIRDPNNARAFEEEFRGEKNLEVVVADISKPETLGRAMQDVEGVYHIAAIFRQAGLPESEFYKINAEGTKNVFEAAIAAGVSRIIHCSTGGVLGHIAKPPGSDKSPHNPGDMYQRSKLEGEKIALAYYASGQMQGVVIRPGMIYGPGDTRNLKLFRMIARGKFFYVGRGEMYVHFVDVRDLARAFVLAMERRDINCEVYHIAGEKAVPLKVMVAEIANYLKVPLPRLHLPVKPIQLLGSICEALCTPFRIQPPIYRRRVDFFTKNRHFDTAKAQRELGFTPAKPFEEELRDLIDWYREKAWL